MNWWVDVRLLLLSTVCVETLIYIYMFDNVRGEGSKCIHTDR